MRSSLHLCAAVWVCSLMTAACAAPLRDDRTVHETDGRYVKLETRYGGEKAYAGRAYGHPLPLSQDDWERMLRQVSVRPRRMLLGRIGDDATPQPAFRDDERAYLARYLARGLARARRDQIVVFYLSRDRDGQLKEISSGACYALDGRIRLVLANYRYLASAPYLQRPIEEDPLRSGGALLYSVVPGEDQEIPASASWDFVAPFGWRPLALSIDYAATLRSRQADQPPGESVVSEETSRQEERRVRESLRTLERLLQEGLMTQEEFSILRERIVR